MKIKAWILIAVAVCLAMGCATRPDPASTPAVSIPPVPVVKSRGELDSVSFDLSLKPDRFNIKVWVEGDTYIFIDQEPVLVLNTGASPIVVVWHLQGGYVFPNDPAPNRAIEMHPVAGVTSPTCSWKDIDRFRCEFAANQNATWKYWVRVRRTNGTELEKLDPTVVQR